MHMTLEADYAVRIVEFLAAANQKVDARTISEETHVPLRFALKILRSSHYFHLRGSHTL